MAFNTSVSLLTISSINYNPRTVELEYTTVTGNLNTPSYTSRSIVFETSGRITTKTYIWDDVDFGTYHWATPSGNSHNPEDYSFRYVYVSGYSLAGSSPANGVWQNASSPMVVGMYSIPSTTGTYESTFTFEVRNSSLVTILSENMTIRAVR